jgi:hypothetical protein
VFLRPRGGAAIWWYMRIGTADGAQREPRAPPAPHRPSARPIQHPAGPTASTAATSEGGRRADPARAVTCP